MIRVLFFLLVFSSVCFAQDGLRVPPPPIGQIPGTATNDDATVGRIGEYVSSVVDNASAVSLTTGNGANITSISLSAGDWDVYGLVLLKGGATTSISYIQTEVGLTSATVTGTLSRTTTIVAASLVPFGTATEISYLAARPRYSLSVTTTIYLVVNSGFSTSTLSAYGIIQARRVR